MINFDLLFELFASMIAVIAVLGLITSFYLLYVRDYRGRAKVLVSDGLMKSLHLK